MRQLGDRLGGFSQIEPRGSQAPDSEVPDRRHADERRKAFHERAAGKRNLTRECFHGPMLAEFVMH